MSDSREKLRNIIDQRSLIIGRELTLSTGKSSAFYFDCKPTTLEGEALLLIANAILEEIDRLPEVPSAIGGLTLGADFIVAAVVMRAAQVGHPVRHGSIVRKEPKKHGTRNRIENELPAGTSIVVVDDVVTTGRSTKEACEVFREAGHRIAGIIAVIDREAGGVESLAESYGCAVRVLFRKRDFPRIQENTEHEPVRRAASSN